MGKSGSLVVRQLQRQISTVYHTNLRVSLLNASGGRTRARLNALRAPLASAWMLPPPLGVAAASNKVCSHAHRLRLGLPLVDISGSRKCVCDNIFTDTNHLQTCRHLKGGARIKRHNDVVNILAKFIHRAGGSAHTEPTSTDPYSMKRVYIDA